MPPLGWTVHRPADDGRADLTLDRLRLAPVTLFAMAKQRSQATRQPSAKAAVKAPPATSAHLEIYDTTLRDGAQAEDVSFSADDKVMVAQRLDDLGVQFIEGGWPGANPRDIEFFRMIKETPFKQATVVAFGSTRKASNPVQKDTNIQALLQAETKVITLFGKSWSLHVTDALGIPLTTNLDLIADSVAYLRLKHRRVFYDAEHFFDGYKTNPEYALETIRRAVEAGAERVILCDTNGGTMPWEIKNICGVVQKECKVPLGIHAHNDCEMAVANSLVAIEMGVVQVQGTINGIGERCGNANLCSIIPNLQLKMKRPALGERLNHLKEVSGFVTEIANLMPNKHQPYVGDSAFAHKGGVHIHAVLKNPATYEHVVPVARGQSPADAWCRITQAAAGCWKRWRPTGSSWTRTTPRSRN